MKKPAILATTLTLLAPPMMAADDPCNPDTGGTFHSCLTHILQRIGQLEKENQAQQAEIQALKMRLSLTDGLVAYYPFDGSANDASGNGHHGTVKATLIKGKHRSAYRFDGKTSEIVISDSYVFTKFPALTIMAWVKNVGGGTLVQQGGWCPDGSRPFKGHSFSFRLGKTKLTMLTIGGSGNYTDPTNTNTSHAEVLQDEQWHFVVGIFKKGEMTLYIDGQKDSATTTYYNNGSSNKISVPSSHFSKIADSSDLIRIGSGYRYCNYKPRNADYFSGAIDELRIYNRALTDFEIQSLYKQ
ncbi:MAG: hypothetical protein DRR19_28070, partial [Candidatus Parabeggiatoa sp. nov. 1]